MKRISSILGTAVLILGCNYALAQSSETEVISDVVAPAAATSYTFTDVNFSGDTFTQLLGVNKNGVIAGYHGSGADAAHPNKGFTYTPTGGFVAENYPASAQTQVIGINDAGSTAGFYVDAKGVTRGFYELGGTFQPINFPGTNFNQLLSWNNNNQGAGYSQDGAGNFHPYYWSRSGPFWSMTVAGIPSAQATGINNLGAVCGFYVNGAGATHGFLFSNAKYTRLIYPGSTFTQALGLNDLNEVVGTYTDSSNMTHGFTWKAGVFQSIDDPKGIGSTVINGVNNAGEIVGFWGNTAAGISHGFYAIPR